MAKKANAEHLDNLQTDNHDLANLANQEDHDLTKIGAIKKYPLAFVWSLYAIWCTLLVSFENQAAGNVVGIPEFRKDFGHEYAGNYVLDANWQSAFQGAPVASGVIGALGCGVIADWLGRRAVIIICLVISYAAITMEFVATTNELFFGGKFLNGFAIGALASVTVTYIGEVAPLALRGMLTCLTGLAYTFGPLVVAIIVNETGTMESRWAYRAVFCAQYGFAVISTIFIFFMPESPWWLVSKGEQEKALKSLARLGSKGEMGVQRLASINKTLAEVAAETEGVTYLECFRKSNLRRTIISIAPLCIQSLSGIVFVASYSTYYIQLAGFSTEMSFKLQIIQQILSLVGNVMSWYLVDHFGRRDLTVYGLLVLTIILFLTGGLAAAGGDGPIKGTVGLIIIYCWWYNVTIGATAYTVLCEVSTSRLRVKTIAIGMACQYALNMIWSFVLPLLFNPDKANLSAKVSFIFGGFAILSLVFLWFWLPETANRTYEELDEMFTKKVPARKFKDFKTDTQAFGETAKADQMDEVEESK
uniref:Major facilitator superfamily (MFS) profile domain-containing protein n=1 Tax=Bionectria ochroleuca TaxID=29856 RepID=A0A8H7NII4_BIOOC